jgi:predicted dehydrogenase
MSTSDPLLAGTFQISFGIPGCSTKMYTLRGTKGTLTVNFGVSPQILTLTTLSTDPNETSPHELVIELPQGEGVLREFEAFGEALTEGPGSESWEMVQQRSGPRATLRDLAIIEAALQSGAASGKDQVDLVALSGDHWEL